MDNENTPVREIVSAAVAGDIQAAEKAFASAMVLKVGEAIAAKTQEFTANFCSGEGNE